MSLLSLSNLLLSHIITSIDSNGDIVCLLLTCKKLYSNNVRKSIQFKGIGEAIDSDKGHESTRFGATATQFKLGSFQDILENSVSDQQIILSSDNYQTGRYPEWIQQRIYAEKRNDKSGVTTALVTYNRPTPSDLETHVKSLYSIPTLEKLFIFQDEDSVDLGSISLLPSLQMLSVRSDKVHLGPHPTLKSLRLNLTTLDSLADLGLTNLVSLTELNFEWTSGFVNNVGPGLLPNSLTFLSIQVLGVPPRDTFLSLTSLVTLDIYHEKQAISQETEKPFIDLESLSNLKTLTFLDNDDPSNNTNYSIEISVPPSLKTLRFPSKSARIPSRCTMPLLEKLYVQQRSLIDGRVCLSSCNTPSLKKLTLYKCRDIIASNIFSSTLEKITICKKTDQPILGQVVFPPSLIHLTIVGDHYEPVRLPDSLVKLKHTIKTLSDALSLPQHLKKLICLKSVFPFSCSNNYPPNLETLNLTDIKGDFTIDNIPPTIKYLSITLNHTPNISNSPPIYSISSRISKINQLQQWLSVNTTHLTCDIIGVKYVAGRYNKTGAFRLDEIINHTNVRYLQLNISNTTTFQFTIQRLDKDNRNILVLETKTMQGGIITQQRKSDYDGDPIYLNFLFSYNSFDLKWSTKLE
ncbi:hypothetical protein DFA_08419 [Cavenderia fasciculata]|uniref:F-box domain-containing protein n=1 Tax=Cavenderia fasciculata TaxID=261658 RepID=F4Q615_CACFS|nr:uncharacterized protein DFA_08419 [Cavenderia fasciculata]EGG17424.1 hypothetical protein DFA_08419 [Cavenderia fasciculata]|eukprot:XP_004355908.1 hypothetical protein DFA_08419 [Cavenderia fasciculata]